MRLSTIASVVVIGLSSAALAQVAQPSPQQTPSGNDMAPSNNMVAAPSTDEADMPPANTMASPSANEAEAAPPAGEPSTATSAPPKR